MSKTKKRVLILSVIGLFIVAKILIYEYLPIKMARYPEVKDGGEAVELNEDMKQIYIFHDDELSWVMMGHDGYEFSSGNYQPIRIKGKFPCNLSADTYNAGYILNGYYTGEKDKKWFDAREFYAESYELYDDFDIKCGDKYYRRKYLTLSDLGAGILSFRIPYIDDSDQRYY